MAEEQKLRQSVKWAEQYVSAALNSKSAGIVPPGVYKGYELAPSGKMAVLVKHSDKYPKSVAVVEREGYSITVIMDDPCTVAIPAKGTWYICIEAYYSPKQNGYQRIVAREKVEDYHIVLGKVVATSDTATIVAANISEEGRNDRTNTDTALQAFEEWRAFDNAVTVRLSDRLTKVELKAIALQGDLADAEAAAMDADVRLQGNIDNQAAIAAQNLKKLETKVNANAKAGEQALADLDARHTAALANVQSQIADNTELQKSVDTLQVLRAADMADTIRLSDRLTKLELASIKHANDSESDIEELTQFVANAGISSGSGDDNGSISPSGYTLAGGATVAPVTIVEPGDTTPSSASLILQVEDV